MALFARSERRGTPAALVVIGLGNPGEKYAHTRHNVGFDVVDLLARRHGGSLKLGKHRAFECDVRIGGQRVILAKPITFMNLSGEAVAPICKASGLEDPAALVIVQDELDLAPGVVKVKAGGGLAGHNGLKSITQHLHTQDYTRVRIGVGKPANAASGVEHVLKRFSQAEKPVIDIAIERAADAVEAILLTGIERAMNAVNTVPTA